MLRSGQYKCVYHTAPDEQHPPQRELYDLKTDPGEFQNMAGQREREALVKKLRAALVKDQGEEPAPYGIRGETVESATSGERK